MVMPDSRRTSAAYRRDLWLARQVIGQLRDQALESGDTFHVGVVDAVAPSQSGGHQRHHLIAGVGSAQVEAPVNQLGQAEMLGQGGRQEQPGIGHHAVIVEGDADAVGVVAW